MPTYNGVELVEAPLKAATEAIYDALKGGEHSHRALAAHAISTYLTAAGHIHEKGWRKIESAPKDVAVLTYGFGYEVAHFNAALDCWVACWDHRPIRPPTEWQPLPSPPSQE